MPDEDVYVEGSWVWVVLSNVSPVDCASHVCIAYTSLPNAPMLVPSCCPAMVCYAVNTHTGRMERTLDPGRPLLPLFHVPPHFVDAALGIRPSGAAGCSGVRVPCS